MHALWHRLGTVYSLAQAYSQFNSDAVTQQYKPKQQTNPPF